MPSTIILAAYLSTRDGLYTPFQFPVVYLGVFVFCFFWWKRQISNSNYLMINRYKKKYLIRKQVFPTAPSPKTAHFTLSFIFTRPYIESDKSTVDESRWCTFWCLSPLVFDHQNLITILICRVLQILIGHQLSLRYWLTRPP